MPDFKEIKSRIDEYATSLEQAKVLEGLAEAAGDAENFAIVTKGGETYFVIMDAQQAIAVNGKSITLSAMPDIKQTVKDLVDKALKTALQIHQNKLALLPDPSQPSTQAKPKFPATGGVPVPSMNGP